MSDKIVKSSGIIMNEEVGSDSELHVFVVNLDPDSDRRVKVEVFNWSTLSPVEICGEVEIGMSGDIPYCGAPIEIEENSAAEFEYDITNAAQYEVRVTFFKTDHNVLVTSQGVYKTPTTNNEDENIPGQTVLNKDFTKISEDDD